MLADRIGADDGDPVAGHHPPRRDEGAGPGGRRRSGPDTVFVPFHWVGANRLTNDALDPSSRMPEFKVCAAAVTRMSRDRLVVVGNGMAATRLVEELVAPAARALTSPCSATSRTRRTTGSCCPPCSRAPTAPDALTLREPEWYAEHGVDLRLGTRVARDRPRRDARSMLVDGTRDRVRPRWCSPPAASRRCRRSAAWSGWTAGCTRRCTRSAASATACGSIGARCPTARTRGRRRRRAARPPGRPGARRPRPRDRGRRGRRPPAAQPGRRARPARSWPATSTRLGTAVYTGARAVRLTDDGPARSTTASRSTPTSSCSPPAAARRPRSPAGPASRCAAASSSTTGCASASPTSDPRDRRLRRARRPGHRLRAARLGAGRRPRRAPDRRAGRRTTAAAPSPGCAPPASTSPCSATRSAPTGEVVEVTNPVAGSHRKLVVRDGVIVAATLVGDLSRIGLITQLYDRRHACSARTSPARCCWPTGSRRTELALARRRRGLRLRRRHAPAGSGPAPRLDEVRDDHPRHHRLRRLRRRRPPARSPAPVAAPHPGQEHHRR